jgi:hypothetical protein
MTGVQISRRFWGTPVVYHEDIKTGDFNWIPVFFLEFDSAAIYQWKRILN